MLNKLYHHRFTGQFQWLHQRLQALLANRSGCYKRFKKFISMEMILTYCWRHTFVHVLHQHVKDLKRTAGEEQKNSEDPLFC